MESEFHRSGGVFSGQNSAPSDRERKDFEQERQPEPPPRLFRRIRRDARRSLTAQWGKTAAGFLFLCGIVVLCFLLRGLILEALAQCGAVAALSAEGNQGKLALFGGGAARAGKRNAHSEPHYLAAGKRARRRKKLEKRYGRHLVCRPRPAQILFQC